MKPAKVGRTACFFFILLLLLGLVQVHAQQHVVLEMVILDNFDDAEAQKWIVRGSKFIHEAKEGEDESFNFPKKVYINGYPEALYGRYYDGAENLYALGVNAAWDRKGYNYVEILPAAEGDDGVVPEPLVIPGRAQRLDMWVWGANYNYYLEVHLMDHRGVPHRLLMGDLNFRGWRNLSVLIPTYIPQYVRWLPAERPLVITKFVVWTRPDARADNYYIYFDELKVLTDVAQARFDGDNLARPELVEELWAKAESGE